MASMASQPCLSRSLAVSNCKMQLPPSVACHWSACPMLSSSGDSSAAVWGSPGSSRGSIDTGLVCRALAKKGGKQKEPYVEPTFVFDLPPGATRAPPSRLQEQEEASSSNRWEDGFAANSGWQARGAQASEGAGTSAAAGREAPTVTLPRGPSSAAAEGPSPSPRGARDGPLPALATPPERSTPREYPGESPPGLLTTPPHHKSGYVALIGQPNAGKSTLLNALIGQKLSIVTRKPQTTRHRILGLCSGPDYQIVLIDTPGVLPTVVRKLDDCMMQSVRSATIDADSIVLVVDITLPCQKLESFFPAGGPALASVRRKPCALVLNKRDALKPGEIRQKVQWYKAEAERCHLGLGVEPIKEEAGSLQGVGGSNSSNSSSSSSSSLGGAEHKGLAVLPISAKYRHGMDDLLQWMLSQLPEGPAYYPKDVVSELPERFFVAEIVREHLLKQYRQEVPYACQVVVRTFRERQVGKNFIQLDIVVETESQKGILVGKGGLALKALATSARLDIEEFLGREAFLDIMVKVKEKWREDEQLLKQFGLNSQARGDWY